MPARPVPELTAVVNGRGRSRVAAGHPWVFAQDVIAGPAHDGRDGGPLVVWITDERGRKVAYGTWAHKARIPLRVLGREVEGDAPPALVPLVGRRFRAALARRAGLRRQRDGLRLCHAEGDGIPGLVVDAYADALVVQTTSVALDAALPELVPLLVETTGARVVFRRDDGSARDFEGLPRVAGVLHGQGPSTVVYRIGETRLEADLLTDSKTGGFLDQAENHLEVAALAPAGARCLDAFAYHGGFALALARSGGPVLATDESQAAIERVTRNAALNQLRNVDARRANAFDLLRQLEAEGRRFDVVVLDPPAFAKRAATRMAADRAYKEIFLRGLRLAEPGGLVVCCSCSGQVTRDAFEALVTEAAADAGRTVQVLARRGAGRDHPELLGVPETGHLKVWILRVLGD